jgi:hypothetical protein
VSLPTWIEVPTLTAEEAPAAITITRKDWKGDVVETEMRRHDGDGFLTDTGVSPADFENKCSRNPFGMRSLIGPMMRDISRAMMLNEDDVWPKKTLDPRSLYPYSDSAWDRKRFERFLQDSSEVTVPDDQVCHIERARGEFTALVSGGLKLIDGTIWTRSREPLLAIYHGTQATPLTLVDYELPLAGWVHNQYFYAPEFFAVPEFGDALSRLDQIELGNSRTTLEIPNPELFTKKIPIEQAILVLDHAARFGRGLDPERKVREFTRSPDRWSFEEVAATLDYAVENLRLFHNTQNSFKRMAGYLRDQIDCRLEGAVHPLTRKDLPYGR